MEDREIHILIEKYLSGTASAEEVKKLNDWYRKNGGTETDWDGEEEFVVKKRIFSSIQARTSSTKTNLKMIWYSVASALLLGVSLFSYYQFRLQEDANSVLVTKVLPIVEQENKYILLPDSSIVILKPGSELKYPVAFVGKNREVELAGEGYFDIKHNEKQPFIIQTGKVKTTVLGTAFTIKTLGENNIEVFVNRGKVKVEDETKELAVLTANHKLIYQQKQQVRENENSVIVEDEFDWKDTNLDFDGMAFSEIAMKLESRYDAKISFLQADLSQYQLSGTFSGIENVDEILTILCKISNSTYTRAANNTYEIQKINH